MVMLTGFASEKHKGDSINDYGGEHGARKGRRLTGFGRILAALWWCGKRIPMVIVGLRNLEELAVVFPITWFKTED
ncbi:hypothetical protein GYH30_049704 [Glycine max]|nr:hypothetical protein GYH30_049704 [Glycine max]